MQIIIPMAGSGERFLQRGYTDIKPLIQVGGKPMIEYVVRLFPGETNFVFICNETHLRTTNLRKILGRIMPKGKVVSIPAHKKGPAWTVLGAASCINDHDQVIVNYCDFNCVWDYKGFKQMIQGKGCKGAIACYKGFHPHLLGPNLYASCRVGKNNKLLEIREKYSFTENKMDCYQSSGTYYFQSGKMLKKYFRELVAKNVSVNGEYYVSLVYNLMLEDNLRTYIYEIEKFCQWGTPDDLEQFCYWLNYFKQNDQNRA